MFFLSSKSIGLAVLVLVIGGVQLLIGWTYLDVSKRELSTVGTLVSVHHGRGSSYEYVFRVNDVSIRDDSGTCKTALTPAGCIKGATVLVYYDREQATRSQLQEFGVAGREKIFWGTSMVSIGLLLIVLHFVFKRALASPDESEATDVDKSGDAAEVIRIIPPE